MTRPQPTFFAYNLSINPADAEVAVRLARLYGAERCELDADFRKRIADKLFIAPRADGSVGPLSGDDMAEAMRTFMAAAGVDLGGKDPMAFLDEMRRAHPIFPGAWLGVLEEDLGWAFTEADDEAEGSGAWIGEADTEGGPLQVHLSSIAYRPGDLGDIQAQQEMDAIKASGADLAVLLFQRLVLWLDPAKRQDRVLFFGGLLYRYKQWGPVYLCPGGPDLMMASCPAVLEPTPAEIERFGFTDYSAPFALAAMPQGIDPTKGFRMVNSLKFGDTRWASPLFEQKRT